MDLATVLGLILAWGALAAGLSLEGGSPKDLFNLPAFVLVIFGTWGATMVGTKLSVLARIPDLLSKAFAEKSGDPSEAISTTVRLARKARRDGILALEGDLRRMDNKFMRKGVELVVDGTPSVMVREILENEIAAMQGRHKVGQSLFTSMGGFSPTLGIIGTVIGLINMLARLNEPGKMGHAIAAAFVATLYGVALANLVYLPIAAKLKARTAEETVVCEMIIEGISSIQAGENPRIVELRMRSFLPPSDVSQNVSGGTRRIRERAA